MPTFMKANLIMRLYKLIPNANMDLFIVVDEVVAVPDVSVSL